MIPAISAGIKPMSEYAIDAVRQVEALLLTLPQELIETDHVIHAGMYARTITVPAGVVATGVEIRIATLLIINGDAEIYVGDSTVRLTGHHVIPASACRKQAILAHKDTAVTMIFATQAKTVEAAESEFTNEAEILWSRRDDAINSITITG